MIAIPIRLDKTEPKNEYLNNLDWINLLESYDKGLNQLIVVLEPISK